MNRRAFLSALATAAAAATFDPERALWVPGKKKIFIPPARNLVDIHMLVLSERWYRDHLKHGWWRRSYDQSEGLLLSEEFVPNERFPYRELLGEHCGAFGVTSPVSR